jgi:hypothetical protein
MIFQRQDDHVVITLLFPAAMVRIMVKENKKPADFQWGKCMELLPDTTQFKAQ